MKIRNIIIGSLGLVFAGMALCACSDEVTIETMPKFEELPDWEDNISGDVYDYTVTMQPERPYMLEYHKMLTFKLFLARPDGNGGSTVGMRFDEALEVIKGLDNLTRGLPKLVYLVGWQFEGHDCKYPSFSQFNEALKRPEDATAQDSFYWLQDEAKKYNTIVSVHANLMDAEIDSPLWHEYVKNDYICREAGGLFSLLAIFNGVPCYNINTKNEWKKGALQKRLDELEKLIRLDRTHTVHFDAFYARQSPYHNVTYSEQQIYMRKIVRYLRDKDIDVTIEFYNDPEERIGQLYGLVPLCWLYNLNCQERATIPPTLMAGGRSMWWGNVVWYKELFLFGDNYGVEDDFNWVDFDTSRNYAAAWKKAKHGISTQTVPYMYYNRHHVERYNEADETVTYDDGLVANYANHTVQHKGVLLREGDNTFFPLPWIEDHREIMAYSKTGYSKRTWSLPADWADVNEVEVREITETGLGEPQTIAVDKGKIQLTLGAYEMMSIIPKR